ncbi:MAG: DUF1700 domain-containing protein [Bacilli bacterium]
MNKITFLHQLRASLQFLSIQEQDEIIAEYDEIFEIKYEEGFKDQAIIKQLGSPELIALEYNLQIDSIKVIPEKMITKSDNLLLKIVKTIALIFFIITIGLPLYITCLILIFSLWLLVLSGIIIFGYSLTFPMPFLLNIGVIMIILGISILLFHLTLYLSKVFARFSIYCFKALVK